MRRIRVISVVIMFALVMCLTACSNDSGKKQFVGTWVSTPMSGDNVTVTFYEDGTFKWVRHLTLGDAETTGRFSPDEKEKYLTMYPNRDPDDKIGTSENEWGFWYVVNTDYMTFYKSYSEEPVYTFNKQK